MHIIAIIICIIVWLFIQGHMRDQGVAPRSRGSLRYQRKKGRRLGVNAADVHINARGPSGWEGEKPAGSSHVSDLAWRLTMNLIGLFSMAVGLFAIVWAGGSIGWWFLWNGVVATALWFIGKRREEQF